MLVVCICWWWMTRKISFEYTLGNQFSLSSPVSLSIIVISICKKIPYFHLRLSWFLLFCIYTISRMVRISPMECPIQHNSDYFVGIFN